MNRQDKKVIRTCGCYMQGSSYGSRFMGTGTTFVTAYEDLAEQMDNSGDDKPEAEECMFFEYVEVSVRVTQGLKIERAR